MIATEIRNCVKQIPQARPAGFIEPTDSTGGDQREVSYIFKHIHRGIEYYRVVDFAICLNNLIRSNDLTGDNPAGLSSDTFGF